MELIETLGLDDLGRVMIRTCGMEGDKAFIMVTAVGDGVGEIVHFKTLEGWTDAAKLIARKVSEFEQYQKIRNDFNRSVRYGSSVPNLQQIPKAAPASSIAIFDDVDNTHAITGRAAAKRHHKRKPQPNRGPIGRKEWT